ncbi:MAG TPA: electron transfer flavoprotein-ubiquinone oxidoreductase [Halomonas sp.]|jgi:electron-transferring-flavoprotein dehydrogenase|uniref:electron transfer flavoprotein-ubiquinone oxidoreductase n=1 Tax=Halomonadaceae TaxID=28256 RepID=UPI000E94DB49|nr:MULTISPECIES: electron transfer flavoprotein-ubiquinone oxidoreductase [Halomonas]MED5297106.1 electron transfer flavoprotein-ubiquinone oxidoreductase [Pseudomonadota bacterium]HAO00699.1 electron transfer flavoprotein-ubiquinone oxidoreductase [Halomonas sp.]MCC4292436.1 electron transfer flavoprotein-ubiquinone oxidoreductase [Halomonas axialensis]MCD1652665.1 electron transfer flavoprotein-ubiquinone oxidoreductase [Halomonas axialensis]MCD2089115.1 electron transfer flavoprotein-ubiqui|tara:strand:+ start:1260 stop:2927 length:1668 start_codon:yes stop_codon:yes gene_type:complete
MTSVTERDSMDFDVVIVGAGPSGLAAACRLMQQANAAEQELSVCVVEKGSEVGAHILSGAVFEPRALAELFPDWEERGAPLTTPAIRDELYLLKDAEKAQKLPNALVPKSMHNTGGDLTRYVISAGNLCRWLAEQAEGLGVEIFPGFAAQEAIVEEGVVKGILIGDMGVGADGEPKDSYMPGMELRAKYTLFAEGARGHIGKRLIREYDLDAGRDPQHYGIGLKELWDIPAEQHEPGLVLHGSGWPLDKSTHGGWFLYHAENQQVVVGLIMDLSYRNPWLSPFDEFQRMKHHPVLAKHLADGKRIAYGARAITKGGLNCLPKMSFPGGLLIGCDAGTLNFAKIKGLHTAMKSGLVAAEAVFEAISAGDEGGHELTTFNVMWESSWAYAELKGSASFGPAIHKYGTVGGGAYNFLNQLLGGKLPNVHDTTPDHAALKPAAAIEKIDYPKPDGKLSFDKLSSVFLSSTNHEEDQPCHLRLADPELPIRDNLPEYAEPAQRYCPAGVYEVIEGDDVKPQFQINFQNCVHCKTCDIKDPAQNITWVAPEGGGGPNYPNM